MSYGSRKMIELTDEPAQTAKMRVEDRKIVVVSVEGDLIVGV